MLIFLAASLPAATAEEAAEAEPPRIAPPVGGKQFGENQPVWVSADGKRVLVDGYVSLREGVLEMFACPVATKEHESVVAVEASAMAIHTALLAVGAQPGSPVRYEPRYQPPKGDEIAVEVIWFVDGEKQTAKAQEWVRNADTGKQMDLPFVFAGSGFWTDPDTKRKHYLAEAGDLICVSNFGAAMLDVPAPSTQANGELWFEPFTERIPPEGTRVRLVLAPVRNKQAAKPGVSDEALDAAISRVRAAEVGAGSTDDLQQAWSTLAGASPLQLTKLLDAMKGATPLAENWLRGAIDAVVDSAVPDDLPLMNLGKYVRDLKHASRARRTAYEIIERFEPMLAQALLDDALDDPSTELRYDAIDKLLTKAAAAPESEREPLFRQALGSARSLDQMETIEAGLEALGEKVSLAKELGFITAWRVIGPFDNREGVGYGTAYPPETTLDVSALYSGQDGEGPQGPFGWKDYTTTDRLGEVELDDAIGTHKGAVGYAWTMIESDAARPLTVRYQSKGATKVWLNNELIAEQEIYHSGSPFDQYVASGKLKQGENTLLIKVCQNEQTEPWAQTWPFALRLTGPAGEPLTGIQQTLAGGQE